MPRPVSLTENIGAPLAVSPASIVSVPPISHRFQSIEDQVFDHFFDSRGVGECK